MLITINKQDAHASELMGADTVKLCEMQGFPPRLENERQSRVEANIWGFKAEFAIARLFNLDPPTINVLSDGGVDLWFDDVSIDVKFTNNEHGDLIFDSEKKFKADIAIAVGKVGGNTLRVNGYADKEFFSLTNHPCDYGYGPRLKVNVNDLKPIERLWHCFMQKRFKG
jgi:hypothetical protein